MQFLFMFNVQLRKQPDFHSPPPPPPPGSLILIFTSNQPDCLSLLLQEIVSSAKSVQNRHDSCFFANTKVIKKI
jgi:hypothetical protein